MRIHHLLAACAVGAAFAASAHASSAQTSTRTSALTLTQAERARVTAAVLADERVRNMVGPNPRVYVGAPLYDKNQGATTSGRAAVAVRRVSVLLYDPRGNRAARAYTNAAGAVQNVEQIPPTDVGIQPEDTTDALQILRQSAQVQRAIPGLERFRPEPASGAPPPPNTYVAQLLPVHSTDPHDPCNADRCADVIFRTPNGYLTVGAHVDLTKRTAEIAGEGRK